MDIQTKKLHFVQEFLRLKDESLVDKLHHLLTKERKRNFEKKLKAMSKKEFNNLIDASELDSENGRLTSARDLKNEIDAWN